MVDHEGERRFWRVPFHSTAVLSDGSATVHAGHLHDISLKGVLFEADGGWQGELGRQYQLRLELSPVVAICMQVTAMNVKDDCVGLRCDEIDIDSMTALRRLISLNAGDDAQLERDLSALVRS